MADCQQHELHQLGATTCGSYGLGTAGHHQHLGNPEPVHGFGVAGLSTLPTKGSTATVLVHPQKDLATTTRRLFPSQTTPQDQLLTFPALPPQPPSIHALMCCPAPHSLAPSPCIT
jgi:hypothetical protein